MEESVTHRTLRWLVGLLVILGTLAAPGSETAARGTGTGTFQIVRTSSPAYVVSNGPREPITIWWSGTPTFPVTMHDAPASCPSGFTCSSETNVVTAPANPLRWAAWWCSGTTRPWTLDFRFWLTDAAGQTTQRIRAKVQCLPRAPAQKPKPKPKAPTKPKSPKPNPSSGGSGHSRKRHVYVYDISILAHATESGTSNDAFDGISKIGTSSMTWSGTFDNVRVYVFPQSTGIAFGLDRQATGTLRPESLTFSGSGSGPGTNGSCSGSSGKLAPFTAPLRFAGASLSGARFDVSVTLSPQQSDDLLTDVQAAEANCADVPTGIYPIPLPADTLYGFPDFTSPTGIHWRTQTNWLYVEAERAGGPAMPSLLERIKAGDSFTLDSGNYTHSVSGTVGNYVNRYDWQFNGTVKFTRRR
jgi:hypothetical protein